MIAFLKDTWELTKLTGEWMKKHWIGYLVLVSISIGLSEVPYLIKSRNMFKTENDSKEEGDM